MSILFLDPLVLAAYVALGIGVRCVWVGRFRSWFGRDAAWTVAAWPLPLVTGMVPILVGVVAGGLARVGLGDDGGGAIVGALYLGSALVPWVLLSFFPPRWLLPAWARARLGRPPPAAVAPVAGAVPAVHAWRGPGHGSRARWVCRVDALPGHLWVDRGELRFRVVTHEGSEPLVAPELDELDDDDVEQLNFSLDDEFRLEAPRGGWWTRRSLDVELGAVDRWGVSSTRPWSSDGLLTLEIEGRRVLRLWVTDVAAIRDAIVGAVEPAGS